MMARGNGPSIKLTEAALLRQIRDLLNHVANRENLTYSRIHQGLGCEPGIADIVGCKGGRFFAIEVKSTTGKLSKAQERWLKRYEEVNAIVIVARSTQDVIDGLGLKFIWDS